MKFYILIIIKLTFLFIFFNNLLCAEESSTKNDSRLADQTQEKVTPSQVVNSEEPKGRFDFSPIIAPSDENEKIRDSSNDYISVFGGVGARRTNWKYSISKENTNSSYKIENATYTSYEGNIGFNRIQTKIGFTVSSEDKLISNTKQWSGYFGIKNLIFRSESGKFKGNVEYSGYSTNYVTTTFDFNNKYAYHEAIYWFSNTPFFAGARRTNWNLPLEIVALQQNRDSGQTVFDKDFKFKYTSLSIGMDYMTQVMMNPRHFRSGWGMLGRVTGNYGWGSATMGRDAIIDGTHIYGGGKHFTETKFDMLTAEMEASMGIMYAKAWDYLKVVGGIGYNYNMFTISSMAKKAKNAEELTPVAMVFFHNHGPIARLQIQF